MIATNPDLQAAIRTHFGKDADSVLLHMTSEAKLDDDKAEEVSDFILEFLDDNAVLVFVNRTALRIVRLARAPNHTPVQHVAIFRVIATSSRSKPSDF